MRITAIMLLLVLAIPVTAQTVSGNVKITGSSRQGAAQNSLFANARFDLCVLGFATDPTNCVNGAATGQAGSAINFLYRPGDPMPFSSLAPANTAALDPNFGSYLVMVSDQNTKTPATAIYIVGSSGNPDLFSNDDTLFLLKNSGGASQIQYIDPVGMFGHTCTPSTPCVIASGIVQVTGHAADATHLASGSTPAFSRASANVIYELQTNGIQVTKRVITPNCTGTGVTLTCNATMPASPPLYVDFTSNTPVSCSVLPSNYTATGWNGEFTVASDDSIAYAIGGGADWLNNHAYSLGDIIYPQTNNGVGNGIDNGYQVTTAGTSAALVGSEPDWFNSCHAAGTTCTDGVGTLVWTGLGNITGQGNGFDILSYSPVNGCARINSRTGKITAGTGSTYTSGSWKTDNQNVCTAFGLGAAPCTLPDLSTLHSTAQTINPDFVKFAPTGGEARCTGDPVIPDNQCSCQYSGVNPQYCNQYYWQKSTNMVRGCTDLPCEGHGSTGYFDWTGGKYIAHDPANPSIPGTGLQPGLANPGTIINSSGWPADQHGTQRWATPGDPNPVGLSVQDVPAVGRIGAGKTLAWYGEFVAGSTDGNQKIFRLFSSYNSGSETNFAAQNGICDGSQTGKLVACPTDMMGTRGSTSPDRIASHTYALGDMIYPLLNNSGAFTYVASVGGAASSTANSAFNFDSSCATTCADGAVTWTRMNAGATTPGCNQIRGDTIWAKNTVFASGTQILPTTLDNNQSIFAASGSGTLTSGSSSPNWTNNCSAYGQTCTDNNITWTNLGWNDCRSDIMIVDTTSAHR